jgi:methionyl-tRNA formyltransferase
MSNSVALVFDKDNNWIYDFFKNRKLEFKNYSISNFFRADEVFDFDIVFLLGYTKILPNEFLQRNKLTLVVHESDLPKGKGFAPIQWQLLEGQSEIKVSLIEATDNVDSGDIFLQSIITFDGTELYEEIREKQAIATINIISEFLKLYPNITRTKQVGNESFYPKRKSADGELDISKTLQENFNLLRVGNNDAWPSFFYFKGVKYLLKISKG